VGICLPGLRRHDGVGMAGGPGTRSPRRCAPRDDIRGDRGGVRVAAQGRRRRGWGDGRLLRMGRRTACPLRVRSPRLAGIARPPLLRP